VTTSTSENDLLPVMEVLGATKTYGSETVFEQVDLRLERGQVLALLGLNGAGKTTMLRVLSGLAGLDAGILKIGGAEFDRFSVVHRRQFALVPDFPSFFDELAMLPNLGIWLKAYQCEGEEAEARALALLEEFDLLSKAKLPVGALSRGQRFKLALAALVAVDPPVWLLDEPFASGMDPDGLAVFRREARAAAQRGATIVYTTQLAELAVGFSDRVVVLHESHFYFDGAGGEMKIKAQEGDRILHRFLPENSQ